MGEEMMFHDSRKGNEYATLWLMALAYDINQDNTGVLQRPEFQRSREHLFTMAKKGNNRSAMVLAGKIAYLSGNRQHAKQLWDDALTAPQKLGLGMFDNKPSKMFGRLHRQTSSPYIELIEAYRTEGQTTKSKAMIDIGCKEDDPTSHYYAALDDKETNLTWDNKQTFTSNWLYHLSKSAASGHAPAMHELGYYYAESFWPYLDDKVPDSVKPTPFDQYPPGLYKWITSGESIWTKARVALGFGTPTIGAPEHDVFHSAATPHTVEGRLRMALAWWELAQSLNYAPSFLAAARLYLLEKVDEDLAAPKDALQLRKGRYRFANEADFEARKHEKPPDARQYPNPVYDGRPKEENKAYHLVREIFDAAKAAEFRRNYVRGTREKASQSFGEALRDRPEGVKQWFNHPDVFPEFMDGKEGVLYDKMFPEMDFLAEVKLICNKKGWQVFDRDDFSLVYQPARMEK